MTPDEHEALQAKMHSIAQQVLLDFLADFARRRIGTLPAAERSATLAAVRTKLEGARQDYSTLALPNMHAAESDLRAALFQEAFESLSRQLLATLERGVSDEDYRQMTGK